MTIAAGFVCLEGLVLFADSEEQEGYIKTSVEKIRKLEKGDRCLVIANAGNGYLADSLMERLFDTLATTKREKDVIPRFRAALIEFHRNEVSLYPSDYDRKTVGLIIGLQLSGDALLLHSDATALRRVSDFAMIGYGAELKYLAQQLYQKNMPIKHGVLIAMHLAKTAREHVQNCGGESRIATLIGHKAEILDLFDIWTDERLFSSLNEVYRTVLLSIPDEEISDNDFNNCVEWFVEEAWRSRAEMLRHRRYGKEIKQRRAEWEATETGLPFERFYKPPDVKRDFEDRRQNLKKGKGGVPLPKLLGSEKSEPKL